MKRGRANGSRAQKWEKLLPIVVAASPVVAVVVVVGAKVSLSFGFAHDTGGRSREMANINDMKNEKINKTSKCDYLHLTVLRIGFTFCAIFAFGLYAKCE